MKNIISAILGTFLKVCIFKYIYKNKELRFLCYYLVVTPVRVVKVIDDNPDTNGSFYPGEKPYIKVSLFSSSGMMSTLVHELVHAKQYRVGRRNCRRGVNASVLQEEHKKALEFCYSQKFDSEFREYYCDLTEVEARYYQSLFSVK